MLGQTEGVTRAPLMDGDDQRIVRNFGAALPEVYGGLRTCGTRLVVGLTVSEPYADQLRALLTESAAVEAGSSS